MKSSRIGISLVSVFLLLLWSAVMLYFYGSGRLASYLPPDGIFRPMVLVSGIGLAVLALFNLATIGTKEADCCVDDGCGHDHDHDHAHGHEHHDHSKCGHDHGPAKAEAHSHEHGHDCCGHDHDHGHEHHDHEHGDDHAGHAHGVLDESGPLGRIIAIMILAVPVTYAAFKTPDAFSSHAVQNKGLYNQNYGQGARAEQFSLKKDLPASRPAAAAEPAVVAATAPQKTLPNASTPSSPAPVETTMAAPTDGLPAANPKEIEKQAAKGGAEPKSLGKFTLEDLKAQVPQNAEGAFLLDVPEIYYTAGDKEVQGVLDGQSVETVAQVLPEKVNNPNGTRVRIFRMLVQCCAADARPYSIPVEFGKEPPKFKDMSWVKVTGKMTFKTEGTQTVPILEAVKMVESAEPDNKMVY